jgi:dihydroflavonol-4-reductase
MVFITGCNGLIGSFIARKLISQNFYVKALKRKDSDLTLLNDIVDKIEWIEGDISDTSILDASLNGVDIVIHAAAIVSYSASEKEKMFEVNIKGTSNIVNAALNNRITKFIHISSVAALGRKKGISVIDENTYWENSSYNTNYAKSKYFGELEVWRGMEEGLNGFIVNPSVVLGPGNWNNGSTKIFKYIWDENLFYSEGDVNFIDVRDVSEIIYKLMMEEKANGERYILNAVKMPYKELFFSIADEFSKKRPGIKANRFISEIAWRLEGLKSSLTGKQPLITKETAKISAHSSTYNNSKVSGTLNHKFIQPEDTINWICRELIGKYSL